MTPEVIQAILATLTLLGGVWVATLKWQANQSKKELEAQREASLRQEVTHAKELALHKDLSQRFEQVIGLINTVRDEVHQLSGRFDQLAVRMGAMEARCDSCEARADTTPVAMVRRS